MTTRQRSAKPAGKTAEERQRLPAELSQVNLNAGGIDVGATSHFVAVPADRAEPQVREFAGFTADLYRLAECGVETVVMESWYNGTTRTVELTSQTAVWYRSGKPPVPLRWVLVRDPQGEFATHRGVLDTPVRRAGRTGLPGDAGRPAAHQERVRPQDRRAGLPMAAAAAHLRPAVGSLSARRGNTMCLRSYLRQRAMLVQYASHHIQHMQKALTQMNVKLQHVISNITGRTGMDIIEAIVDGERDPRKLAQFRRPGIKADEATIAKSLQGHWREEHIFELTQALELYRFYL